MAPSPTKRAAQLNQAAADADLKKRFLADPNSFIGEREIDEFLKKNK
jgi:hypothetical protein